jgi:hypothetical protein
MPKKARQKRTRKSANRTFALKPSFASVSVLVRHIHPNNRMKANRPSSTAFEAQPGPPRETHLSVNSLEVESLNSIAAFYSAVIEGRPGVKVAVCQHKLHEYNDAASFAGLRVHFQHATSTWIFTETNSESVAYLHRPVTRHDGFNSLSHCGVEFIRALREEAEQKFARRMARQRFHYC